MKIITAAIAVAAIGVSSFASIIDSDFAGSGGLDHLVIASLVPTPGALALVGLLRCRA